MTTTSTSKYESFPSSNGHHPPSGAGAGAPRLSWQRRRQLPLLAAGVVLVVGCALLFAAVSAHSASGRLVLVATRSLPVGHVLAPDDLTAVSLSGTTVASVPAGGEAGVVGRPLAVGLAAGALLIPADVGSAAGVAAGRAVVALALKPGQYPPMLGPGDHVQILDTSSGDRTNSAAGTAGTTSSAGSLGPVPATVLAVDPQPEGSAVAVVASVQVDAAQAGAVAAMGARGTGSVVLLPSGSGAG